MAIRSPSVDTETGHEQAERKTWVTTCTRNLKSGFSAFDGIQESISKAVFNSLSFSILKKKRKENS